VGFKGNPARFCGCATTLVLTGLTTREMLDVSDVRPDQVIPSVAAGIRSHPNAAAGLGLGFLR